MIQDRKISISVVIVVIEGKQQNLQINEKTARKKKNIDREKIAVLNNKKRQKRRLRQQ